jgi:hypothetical protein
MMQPEMINSTVGPTGLKLTEQLPRTPNDILLMREQLKTLRAWPVAGDEYLKLMPEFNHHALPLSKSDEEWLPQVVADCLCGKDIGFKYPAFFQKLLINPRLRRFFLASLQEAVAQQKEN